MKATKNKEKLFFTHTVLDMSHHFYHPDYYLEKWNLIVEIKSHYWFQVHQEVCLAKQKASLEQGYDYIMIMDKNYEEFFQFLL